MATPPLPDAVLQAAVNAVAKHQGNVSHAAVELNMSRATLRNRLDTARRRGVSSTIEKIETLHGWNPSHDLTKVIPDPLVIRGTSSLYKDGVLKLQWVKTKLDDQRVEVALRAAVDELAAGIPRALPITPPTHFINDLCCLITLTDCHIGMKAWKPETGDDWDLAIAEEMLTKSVDYLIEASPPASLCFINQLGDFLHFDSLQAVTPLHGNLLDADSRYSKVVRVATRILRYAVDKALRHYERVVVLISEGNHDPASSVWLRHLFGLLYENEPRASVMEAEMPYSAYEHGTTLLAFHHGHLTKIDKLPILFAAQFPEEWGRTKYRFCHTGHQHHEEEKEHSGMTVIMHPTMAGRDAYAARGGWIAARRMNAITYHTKYGRVATTTVVPEMLV